MLTKISFHISPSDYHWYITTNYPENEEEKIKSEVSGPTIFSELEWKYLTHDIKECVTDMWYMMIN